MNIKYNLRKITELGIALTAATTLALAGCGGGGGSSGSAACSATGNASGAVAANCFFAETVAGWDADLAGTTNAAGTSSMVASARIQSFVANGANSYSYTSTYQELATTSSTWSTAIPSSSPYSWYYLSATDWQPVDFFSTTYTNNGDGTITAISTAWGQAEVTSITRTDLTGQPVVCTNPMGSNFVGENAGSASSPLIVTAASCPVAVTYPAGSISYTTTGSSVMNESYILVDPSTPITLTDGTGTPLSALPDPDIGTQFCMNGRVYDPIASLGVGADNYNVYYNYTSPGGCTASDINTTLSSGWPWTVLISLKTTGNANVPNVFNIKTRASLIIPTICEPARPSSTRFERMHTA